MYLSYDMQLLSPWLPKEARRGLADSLELELQVGVPCACWGLSPGVLDMRAVHLITKPLSIPMHGYLCHSLVLGLCFSLSLLKFLAS